MEPPGTRPQPAGLGGWMTLAVIGLYLTPLRAAGNTLEVLVELYRAPAWTPAMRMYALWTCGSMTLLAGWAIATLVLAHRHDRRFPKWYVAMWGVAFLQAFITLFVILPSVGLSPERVDIIALILTGAIGAIWSIYMIRSRRVAATFGRWRQTAP